MLFGLDCPTPPKIDVHLEDGEVFYVGELKVRNVGGRGETRLIGKGVDMTFLMKTGRLLRLRCRLKLC